MAVTAVNVFWGSSDGFTASAGAFWTHTNTLGTAVIGALTTDVSGLATNTLYYYRYYATNQYGEAWATPAASWITGEITLGVADEYADESGLETATFRVTRPVWATNTATTVYYTVGGTATGGTATPGADYAALSGSVLIPAGQASADILVRPFQDSVWWEGDETVVVTLSPGSYLVGAANQATTRIHDEQIIRWAHRLPVRVSGYTGGTTLANFPVLLTLSTNLAGFAYDQFLSGENRDLRFMDASLTRELHYEVETWNPTGASAVWVKLPTLTNGANFWMLWGKADVAAPDCTTNGATFSEHFHGVWHMTDGFTDATPSNHHGSIVGTVRPATGIIGGAQDVSSGGLATAATIAMSNQVSLSAWVYRFGNDSTPWDAIVANQHSTGGNDSFFFGYNSGDYRFFIYTSSQIYLSGSTASNGEWRHIAGVYDGTDVRFYENGDLNASRKLSGNIAQSGARPITIGGDNNGNPSWSEWFNGILDEVRVSPVARSADWIQAEYANVASPHFLTCGVVQAGGAPAVDNRIAGEVTPSSATLNGTLLSPGDAPAAVAVYWGLADGGTNAAAWSHTNWISTAALPGLFAASATGLPADSFVFYRFAATNVHGACWAPETALLFTGPVTLRATDAAAAESGPDPGSFTVSCGMPTPLPLPIAFTLGGTAVNGTDYAHLDGTATIPVGTDAVTIQVSPIYSHDYPPLTETVVATLAPGPYRIGSPDADTVTITNQQELLYTFDVPRNFRCFSPDALTGASDIFVKTGPGELRLMDDGYPSFTGNLLIDKDGGQLTLGGLYLPGTRFSGMTSANTIAIRPGGTLYFDENGNTAMLDNRFGTAGNRPHIHLAGTLYYDCSAYDRTYVQTFDSLTLGSGASRITAICASPGIAELHFSSLASERGATIDFGSSSALGSGGVPDTRIYFDTPPLLVGGNGAPGTTTMSIVPKARDGTDLVCYDVYGIRNLSPSEYLTRTGVNDINGVDPYENITLAGTTTPFASLVANQTINALLISAKGNGSWPLSNKLTLSSGQLLAGLENYSLLIGPGTLTAGAGSDTDLDIYVGYNTTTISATLADNGAGQVALVKHGGGTLVLDGGTGNTYSGGSFVNEGTLTTGTRPNNPYLGTERVVVNNASLTLGSSGATANHTGFDYRAINGGQIQVGNAGYTADDTFSIESGCIIQSSSLEPDRGLNSLSRGAALSNTANIVLAPGAVIGHPALTSPMYLTIRDLGSAADLFYGLVEDVVRAEAAVTIGAGTPFRGLSTGRANQKWSLGTIHVAAGTSEIALQGLSVPGNVYTLTLGQGSTAGGPVIHPATPGTVNAKLFGNVTLNDDTACFGDTSTGRIIHFQVASGATLGISMPEAMGSGTGVATCEVLDGGTLSLDNEYGINGSTTIRAGGLFKANDSGGLVGTGALTFESGSILELTTANAFNS